ncbi:MAG: hypothetical protein HC822_08755 [Oscillochloris sp.]|nr:hypothetical protein [Oscillochloris sp.]
MLWYSADDLFVRVGLDPNRSFVALAQVCATLGLNTQAEERRLQDHGLLNGRARVLAVEDEETGEEHDRLCIPVELLPLWLTAVNSALVADSDLRMRLELFQRESASLLWQALRPQGFDGADELVAVPLQRDPAEQAYTGSMAMATLARQQMLIERQLDGPRHSDEDEHAEPHMLVDPWAARAEAIDDPTAARMAQTVRRIARTLGERTRRNEYYGVFSGLYRNFGIASYRRMPPSRLYEALEWLERWHGDLLGEPEPPPDI